MKTESLIRSEKAAPAPKEPSSMRLKAPLVLFLAFLAIFQALFFFNLQSKVAMSERRLLAKIEEVSAQLSNIQEHAIRAENASQGAYEIIVPLEKRKNIAGLI